MTAMNPIRSEDIEYERSMLMDQLKTGHLYFRSSPLPRPSPEKTVETVQEYSDFDDRDKALLDFLRSNAGRAFTVKFLCNKFGYNGAGSGSQLRSKLNEFLAAGHPVRRLDKGVMWCFQGRQLQHYADGLEKRAAAIMRLATAARAAGTILTERELK